MYESTRTSINQAINDGCVIARNDDLDDGEMFRRRDVLVMGTAHPWRAEARNIVRVGLASALPWLRVPEPALPTDLVIAELRPRREREVHMQDGPAQGKTIAIDPHAFNGQVQYAVQPPSAAWFDDVREPTATTAFDTVIYTIQKYGTRDDYRLIASVG